MQTKRQIEQLLASAGIRPNKRLGQNFLIDLNLMQLLIASADITNGDIVLEVGCGTGSLTQGLAERAGCVLAVEVDNRIAEIAQKQLADRQNVEIINADILKNKNTIDPAVLDRLQSFRKKYQGRLLLVANLPYNTASPVVLNLIAGARIVDGVYVTIQKEVAERMAAPSNTRHYGTLSILLAATGSVKIIRVLKPSVFWPQPRVDSAMVAFVRSPEKVSRIRDMELFSRLVSLFMQHRRKMLKACTKFAAGELTQIDNWPGIFQKCGIDPTNRPEQISPDDYIAIANLCAK